MYINSTLLYIALEENELEIAKLLLANENIDTNIINILIKFFYLIQFQSLKI